MKNNHTVIYIKMYHEVHTLVCVCVEGGGGWEGVNLCWRCMGKLLPERHEGLILFSSSLSLKGSSSIHWWYP
jgi:hypothetical protein